MQQLTLKAAAAAFNVSGKTAAKWVRRYQQLGRIGLRDRSSRPHRSPRQTSSELVRRVQVLRRQRWTGFRIARETGLSCATVSRILRQLGLHRLGALDPAPPVVRYEHTYPGSLLHLDIKALGRFDHPHYRYHPQGRHRSGGTGWEYLHIAIDDYFRLAFAQILPDQSQHSALAFLRAARAYYAQFGIRLRRVMTDNGGCYRGWRFRRHLRQLHLRHLFTRPYTPRTNGKAERFIQTALREWVRGFDYQSSQQRQQCLPIWLHQYNYERPHASLNHAPPISRVVPVETGTTS